MKGKFYGIGVGPGDPGLLTVKAVELIRQADVIVCPESKKDEGSIALKIAAPYLRAETEQLALVFPMTHDKEILAAAWRENAIRIHEETEKGKTLVFLTLGDPTVFSTYMYMVPYLVEQGVEVETVPGITSFTAVASRLNLPLTLGHETLAVVPLMKGCENARAALENFDNCVIMKPSHDSETLAALLTEMGLQDNFVLISKCGTEEETLCTDINQLAGGKVPYLSTMIVKKGGISLG